MNLSGEWLAKAGFGDVRPDRFGLKRFCNGKALSRLRFFCEETLKNIDLAGLMLSDPEKTRHSLIPQTKEHEQDAYIN